MKNKKHLLICLFVLIGAGIIGLIWSAIDFTAINKTRSYAYQTIQFDYDGAFDGKDPNGNPFNPTSFLTDEVITEALTKSGLSYEVDSVKQYIKMENIVPKNIVKEIESYSSILNNTGDTRNITTNDYHPVKYRFVLYSDLDKGLSKSDLSTLLSNIVDSYCESFYKTYKLKYDFSSYDSIYNIDSYDYIYQVEVLSNKISILSSYADEAYKEHDDFSFDDKSFNDIVLKTNQLISSDASRIKNIIILNALSKDITRLKDYYNYKIEMLNYDKVKYTADLANITTQIDNYSKDSTVYVSSGENIVKVESNSSATYNALLSSQIDIANKIASINTSISDYQSILTDINNAVATEEDYTLVRNYITKLSSDYNSVEEEFLGLVEKYNDKYITNTAISKTNVKYYSSSIISTSFIVRAIKICAPICLVALLGISVYLLARETKKKEEVAA